MIQSRTATEPLLLMPPVATLLQALERARIPYLLVGSAAIGCHLGQVGLLTPSLCYAQEDRVRLHNLLDDAQQTVVDRYVVLKNAPAHSPAIRIAMGGVLVSAYEEVPYESEPFASVWGSALPLELRGESASIRQVQQGRVPSREQTARLLALPGLGGGSRALYGGRLEALSAPEQQKVVSTTEYIPDLVTLLESTGHRQHRAFSGEKPLARVFLDTAGRAAFAVFRPNGEGADAYVSLTNTQQRGDARALLAHLIPDRTERARLEGLWRQKATPVTAVAELPQLLSKHPARLRELIWHLIHPLTPVEELGKGPVGAGFWGQVLAMPQPDGSIGPADSLLYPLTDSDGVRFGFVRGTDPLHQPIDCPDACWVSNWPVYLAEDIRSEKAAESIEAGRPGYLYRHLGRYRFVAEDGRMSEILARRPEVAVRPLQRLVLVTHPRHALRFHQHFAAHVKASAREAILYVAVGEQLDPGQIRRLEGLLADHPRVKVTVAGVMDEEGIKPMLRLISLGTPAQLPPQGFSVSGESKDGQLLLHFTKEGSIGETAQWLQQGLEAILLVNPVPVFSTIRERTPLDTPGSTPLTILESTIPYSDTLGKQVLTGYARNRNAWQGDTRYDVVLFDSEQGVGLGQPGARLSQSGGSKKMGR